jgi:hypothetical protein
VRARGLPGQHLERHNARKYTMAMPVVPCSERVRTSERRRLGNDSGADEKEGVGSAGPRARLCRAVAGTACQRTSGLCCPSAALPVSLFLSHRQRMHGQMQAPRASRLDERSTAEHTGQGPEGGREGAAGLSWSAQLGLGCVIRAHPRLQFDESSWPSRRTSVAAPFLLDGRKIARLALDHHPPTHSLTTPLPLD